VPWKANDPFRTTHVWIQVVLKVSLIAQAVPSPTVKVDVGVAQIVRSIASLRILQEASSIVGGFKGGIAFTKIFLLATMGIVYAPLRLWIILTGFTNVSDALLQFCLEIHFVCSALTL